MRQLDRHGAGVRPLRLNDELFASHRRRIARGIQDPDGRCPIAIAQLNWKRPLAIGANRIRQFEDRGGVKLDLQIRPGRGRTSQTGREVGRDAIGLIDSGVVNLIVNQATGDASGNRCHRVQRERERRAGHRDVARGIHRANLNAVRPLHGLYGLGPRSATETEFNPGTGFNRPHGEVSGRGRGVGDLVCGAHSGVGLERERWRNRGDRIHGKGRAIGSHGIAGDIRDGDLGRDRAVLQFTTSPHIDGPSPGTARRRGVGRAHSDIDRNGRTRLGRSAKLWPVIRGDAIGR